MSKFLFEKIYGWLMGAGIGDAMGAPVEDMHYLDIREQFGVVDTFRENLPRYYGGRPDYEVSSSHWHERRLTQWQEPHPLGQFRLKPGVYTDDLRYRYLICKSMIKRGRVITGKELAEDLLGYVISCGFDSKNQIEYAFASAMFNLEELLTVYTGRPFIGNHSGGGLWGAPAGIVNPGNLQAAAQDGGIMGAVIAAAMLPTATVDSVIKATFDFAEFAPGRCYSLDKLHGLNGDTPSGYSTPTPGDNLCRRLERALKDANQSADVFDLIERLYKWLLIAYPSPKHSGHFEFLVASLAFVYKAKGDPRQAIIGGVNYGRDNDTIASNAGEICGALKGISAFPQDWVNQFIASNPNINLAETAKQMADLVAKELKRAQQTATEILSQP